MPVIWRYNRGMQQSPVNSFFRFVSGFLLFITLSFGITYAAQELASRKDGSAQAAAAIKAMLEQHPSP